LTAETKYEGTVTNVTPHTLMLLLHLKSSTTFHFQLKDRYYFPELL